MQIWFPGLHSVYAELHQCTLWRMSLHFRTSCISFNRPNINKAAKKQKKIGKTLQCWFFLGRWVCLSLSQFMKQNKSICTLICLPRSSSNLVVEIWWRTSNQILDMHISEYMLFIAKLYQFKEDQTDIYFYFQGWSQQDQAPYQAPFVFQNMERKNKQVTTKAANKSNCSRTARSNQVELSNLSLV